MSTKKTTTNYKHCWLTTLIPSCMCHFVYWLLTLLTPPLSYLFLFHHALLCLFKQQVILHIMKVQRYTSHLHTEKSSRWTVSFTQSAASCTCSWLSGRQSASEVAFTALKSVLLFSVQLVFITIQSQYHKASDGRNSFTQTSVVARHCSLSLCLHLPIGCCFLGVVCSLCY